MGELDDRRPPCCAQPEPKRGGNRSRREPDAPQPGTDRGLPGNFFVVNPDVNYANVTDSGAFSKYNALQLELRRRLSNGFSANVNYQYAFEGGSQFDGFSFGRAWTDIPVTGNPTVRHALKFQADWTLPFGRGERFGGDSGRFTNALIGGWSVSGVGRVQQPYRTSATYASSACRSTICRTFTSSTARRTRPRGSTRSGCSRTTSSSTRGAPSARSTRRSTGIPRASALLKGAISRLRTRPRASR